MAQKLGTAHLRTKSHNKSKYSLLTLESHGDRTLRTCFIFHLMVLQTFTSDL